VVNHERALIAVLELVAQNDDECGWYQLDRALVLQGIGGVHVGSVVQELLDKKLVTSSGEPSAARSRYCITDAGHVFLQVRAGSAPQPS